MQHGRDQFFLLDLVAGLRRGTRSLSWTQAGDRNCSPYFTALRSPVMPGSGKFDGKAGPQICPPFLPCCPFHQPPAFSAHSLRISPYVKRSSFVVTLRSQSASPTISPKISSAAYRLGLWYRAITATCPGICGHDGCLRHPEGVERHELPRHSLASMGNSQTPAGTPARYIGTGANVRGVIEDLAVDAVYRSMHRPSSAWAVRCLASGRRNRHSDAADDGILAQSARVAWPGSDLPR